MKRKTKIYLILTASLVTVLVLASFNWFSLRKRCMVIFNKTGIVARHNSRGRIDGEYDVYLNGNVIETENYKDGILNGLKVSYNYDNGNMKTRSFYKAGELEGFEFNYYDGEEIKSKESFKDGKPEGPKITYYENGQIEQRLFRKNGKDEGIEYGYYDDGKLKYKRNWVNDHPYGDFYAYYEDGKVQIYHAFDILGDKFYISHYDESGKRSQSDGYTFSTHTYSRDVIGDSSLVLENNKSYSTIRDLYITVANPPDSTIGVKIVINNKRCPNLTFPDNNTVKVVNAFPKKGAYHIFVDVECIDKSNKTSEGTSGGLTVIKSK